MAVTMQQVAELAGVSRGTVDRVLHGRPNVDAVVREKVLRAAETGRSSAASAERCAISRTIRSSCSRCRCAR